MQSKQAPRVAANPFAGLGSKLFFCLFLLPALLICASAETSGGGTTGTGTRITIYPNSLPTAAISVPYSATISVRGGTAPYQFVFAHGTIPPGLSLNTTTGMVAGTPTTAGSFSFRVLITDLPNADRGEVTVSITVGGGTGVSVLVSPSSASVPSAGTQQFSATVSNSSNSAVTWTADGGTISSSGLFTARSVTTTSTATVTATSVADPTKYSRATVTVNPLAGVSVAVSPTSSSLISAGTQQFTATVSNTSNTSVTWTATGGTITSSGMFTAPSVSSPTTATVTATSVADTTKSAHSSVAINPPATVSVAVSPNSTSVLSAGTQLFTATVSNASNTNVTWSASSGTISSNGVFTAPSVTSSTTATVVATSVADTTKSAQATVFVTPPTPGPPPPPPPPSTGADNTYCGTGDVANFGGNDTVAALPQACINTALANTPSPGKVTTVSAGGSVQNALNSAACGDTIMLQAGATFSGTFSLPNKGCDGQHWITIRTSAPDSSLPSEGTRLTPCYAGVASLPGRPAYYCPSAVNVMPMVLAGGNQAFITQSGAGFYRLVGLEITHPAGMPTGQPDTLVALTDGTKLPHHVIIDRCWIHGLSGATWLKRGIKLDGTYLAVIDSTVTDVHANGTDNQGIASGTGTGPLKMVNNFIEGGAASIGFGGQGDPYGNPQDVEIRRNHLFYPLAYMANTANWNGSTTAAKVRLESKNSNRVLIEGNILENAWGQVAGGVAQGGDGSIAWLGPKDQSNACPTCDVSDITFRYNLIRHAGGGLYIFDAASDLGGIAQQAMRYSIHDNLLDDISTAWSRNGSGNAILNRFFGTSSYPPAASVAIFHNTGLASGLGLLSLSTAISAPYANFSFTNNLETNGTYGIMGCGGIYGTVVLTTCAPGYNFAGNVIVGGTSAITAGALKPSSASTVSFVNFNNGNGGDYRLCQGAGNPVSTCTAASPYVNAGTDGRDIGADVTTLYRLVAGVN
jgi:hypothetical protein